MTEIRNVPRSIEIVQNMRWILKQARSGAMDTPDREISQSRDEEMDSSIGLSLSIRHFKRIL